MAVEILSRALFTSGQARQVIAVQIPESHAMMHLDTVMTMIDRSISSSTPISTGTSGPGQSHPPVQEKRKGT